MSHCLCRLLSGTLISFPLFSACFLSIRSGQFLLVSITSKLFFHHGFIFASSSPALFVSNFSSQFIVTVFSLLVFHHCFFFIAISLSSSVCFYFFVTIWFRPNLYVVHSHCCYVAISLSLYICFYYLPKWNGPLALIALYFSIHIHTLDLQEYGMIIPQRAPSKYSFSLSQEWQFGSFILIFWVFHSCTKLVEHFAKTFISTWLWSLDACI